MIPKYHRIHINGVLYNLIAPYYLHNDERRERLLDSPHTLLSPFPGGWGIWSLRDGQPPAGTMISRKSRAVKTEDCR